MYTSFIRPVIEYGSILYCSASSTHLSKLDRVQHGAELIGGFEVDSLHDRRCAAIASYSLKILDGKVRLPLAQFKPTLIDVEGTRTKRGGIHIQTVTNIEEAHLASQQTVKDSSVRLTDKEQLALAATHERVVAEQASIQATAKAVQANLDMERHAKDLQGDNIALGLQTGQMQQISDQISELSAQLSATSGEMQARAKVVETSRETADAAKAHLLRMQIATGEISDDAHIEAVSLDDGNADHLLNY